MEKIDVNGGDASPLYEWLKEEKKEFPINNVAWNFEKFLIGRDGKVVARYRPTSSPKSFEDEIQKQLSINAA